MSYWDDFFDNVQHMGAGALGAVGFLADAAIWPVDVAIGGVANAIGGDGTYRTELDKAMDPGGLYDMMGRFSKGFGGILAPLSVPLDYSSDVIASGVMATDSDITFGQAWEQTHNAPVQDQISPGQAILNAFWGGQTLDPAVVRDRQTNPFYNFLSGTVDAANSLFLDPLVGLGKASKLAKTKVVDRPLGAKKRPEKIDQYLASSSWEKLWEWKQGKSVEEIANVPGLRGNEYRTQIAAALDMAKTRQDFDLIGRITLGDMAAYASLEKSNETLALGLAHAVASRANVLGSVQATQMGGQMLVGLYNQQIKHNTELMEWQDRILDLPQNLGYSTPGGFSILGTDVGTSWRYNRAAKIAAKANQTIAPTMSDSVKMTGNPLMPAIRLYRMSRPGSAPTGWLDLNRTEHGELQNMLNMSALLEVDRIGLINDYMRARSTGERAVIASRAERAAMESIALKHGYTRAEADAIMAKYARERDSRLNAVRERAYSAAEYRQQDFYADMIDDDGALARLPLYRSQLADAIPMPDMRELDKYLRRDSVKNAVRTFVNEGKDAGVALGDAMSGFWKMSVLLRLGYPVRVLTDDHFRMLAKLGALTYARQAGQSAGVFVANRMDWAQAKLTRKPYEASVVGQGTMDILGYKLQDAYGATYKNNPYWGLSSSQQTWDRTIAVASDHIYKDLKAGQAWRHVAPTEPEHIGAWYDVLTRHIKTSPIARKLLDDEDPRDVVAWLSSSDPEARKLRREVPWFGGSPASWVGRIEADIENLIPTRELGDALLDGSLTREKLSVLIPDPRQRPDVNAPLVQYNTGYHPVHDFYQKTMGGLYKMLGTLPTDSLSRHPFFATMYRQRVKDLARMAHDHLGAGNDLPPKWAERMERQGREYALDQTRKLLMDISQRSELSHVMRFMSPFFSAWQNSMSTWLGLMKADPSLFPRANTIWNAPNQVRGEWFGFSFEVVDENGEPVKDRKLWMTDTKQVIRIQVPKYFSDTIPFMEGVETVDISKTSLFSIAQGETPWLPGGGPMIAIPAGLILKEKPELESSLSWLFPYGPPENVLSAVLPTGFRNLAEAYFGDSSDASFGQVQFSVMQAEIVKYQTGERKTKPTWAEVSDRASKLFGLKAAASFILPFAPNVRSPFQFYIDEYHKLQREADPRNPNGAGLNPDEIFYKNHGDDLFILTASLNKNNTGIASTQRSYKLQKKYADEIARNPELGRLIVGPEGAGDFSTSVYRWQFEQEAERGTGLKGREVKTPGEALKDFNERHGWMKYRKIVNNLTSQMEFDGLTSFDESGAEDYKEQRDEFIEGLKVENPDWFKEYSTFDSQKMIRRIDAFESLVKEPKLAGDAQRSDIRVLATYLEQRRKFVDELKSRKESGAPGSLEAEDNVDIREEWEEFKTSLAMADTLFHDLFYTYLEFDRLQF